jgi:hypothetical protein
MSKFDKISVRHLLINDWIVGRRCFKHDGLGHLIADRGAPLMLPQDKDPLIKLKS